MKSCILGRSINTLLVYQRERARKEKVRMGLRPRKNIKDEDRKRNWLQKRQKKIKVGIEG